MSVEEIDRLLLEIDEQEAILNEKVDSPKVKTLGTMNNTDKGI